MTTRNQQHTLSFLVEFGVGFLLILGLTLMGCESVGGEEEAGRAVPITGRAADNTASPESTAARRGGDGATGTAVSAQAELLRADATARAQEAITEAQGESDEILTALGGAREQLKTEIRTATSVDGIVAAKDQYEAEAPREEALFSISPTVISEAAARELVLLRALGG